MFVELFEKERNFINKLFFVVVFVIDLIGNNYVVI